MIYDFTEPPRPINPAYHQLQPGQLIRYSEYLETAMEYFDAFNFLILKIDDETELKRLTVLTSKGIIQFWIHSTTKDSLEILKNWRDNHHQ